MTNGIEESETVERNRITLREVFFGDGKWLELVTSNLAIFSSIFALYTGLFGEEVELIQRGVHLGFSVALIYFITGKDSAWWKRVPSLLAALVLLYSAAYIVFEYNNIMAREGELTTHEITLGVILFPLILEASRRSIGLTLPLVSLLFVAYAYFGPFLPFGLGHRGYDIERLASHLFMSTDGIYGTPLGVSATFIFMFVLFGAFLQVSGAGEFLINLAIATTGRSRGGPAKIAVVSSAFFGTMSGSAIANASATGTFTIPLMRRVGYKPHIAASFESLASLGGQLMPPIMGSAAFVMVEFTQIAYLDIAAAALFPGLLFFFSVFVIVDLEAARNNLSGLPKSELPSVRKTLNEGWMLFVPLVTLFTLLYLGYSTFMSAFWSIPTVILVAAVKRSTRLSFPQFLEALRKGGLAVTKIAVACACSGIIVGVATLTGLAVDLSNLMIELAGGSLFNLLLLTMVVSIILGMGLPTVACYILLAVLVGPALEQMGLSLLASHLFIFYFGIVSGITPPVALVSYAAAGVANTDAIKTSWTACRLGIAIYILPYAFVYVPELLLIGEWHNVVIRILLAFGSLYVFVAAIQGYLFVPLNIVHRLGLGCLAVCLLIANVWIYLPAAAFAVISVLFLRRSVGRTTERTADHSARK
ncbi:MAG: TRAP transporter permease [Rhodospirillaceae bacterium]|nr:TRAP transporter permease [Rhodospirillaceae bacterium]